MVPALVYPTDRAMAAAAPVMRTRNSDETLDDGVSSITF